MQTIVLGLGNELLGDEGVGVHAARWLQRQPLPASTRVLEVGTAILNALSDLESAERVIVLDAMQADGPPGTVYRIPLDGCRGSSCIASMHGFDIFRVMLLAGSGRTPPVTVFGVEPERLDWSLDLSPAVRQAVPLLVEAVRREILNLCGMEVTASSLPEPPSDPDLGVLSHDTDLLGEFPAT